MSVTHPWLSAEFHATKNGELTPAILLAGTHKKLWWQCLKNLNHVWQARGSKRVTGQGCPLCSGKKVDQTNNMAATHPELAAEFHPTKNGRMSPDTIVAGTGKKLWWICSMNPDSLIYGTQLETSGKVVMDALFVRGRLSITQTTWRLLILS